MAGLPGDNMRCSFAVAKSTLDSGGLFRTLTEGRERALKVLEKPMTGVQVNRDSREISGAKLEAKQLLIMIQESGFQ